ncbi:MAG: sulfatase-like hydrolase/transferase, partial [Candidatus Aminicenantes bacterium]|nr:sulfatase-like hydrolase/transferase [Candidatus Aminicenantes bacterium]
MEKTGKEKHRIGRREFVKTAGLGAAALSLSPFQWGCRSKARRPNIIYIMADDLGYGELGCYGQTKIRTPHIDRLAAEGKRFTQHYSGSPVCAPSRCVLLTGKHTGHAYIRANDEMNERGDVWNDPNLEGQRPLPSGTETIGTLFQKAGYRTGAVGKWGLGGPNDTGHPNDQGFDFWYGYLCQRVAHNYYPTHLWKNRDKDILEGNPYFSPHQK